MADLESGRIKELHDQQLETQKKSFTKWINNHLASSSVEVKHLFNDLKDGSILRTLLETISGESLQKLNRGSSKVHHVSNVSVSFNFLKRHNIRLVGIGPEDVVDGIPDLVLGLVWSIIQKYHITAIEIVLDSDEKKHAKEALLLWSQRRTEGYPHVRITDFSNPKHTVELCLFAASWRDGLAFLALIHAHRPDLVEYRLFKPTDRAFNLETAFRIAEKNLNIARILDVEDMDKERPDEKSVMTYLAYYFHCFSQLDHTKRRSKKLNTAVGIERLKYTYEGKVTLLLQWMRESQAVLSSRDFPNTLHGVQKLCQQLNHFRRHEVKFRYVSNFRQHEVKFRYVSNFRQHEVKFRYVSATSGSMKSSLGTSAQLQAA
ncbi:Calponin domain [Trinorchestia longiramus]|nr:Calponin domain [Trinorchestia longiramus]